MQPKKAHFDFIIIGGGAAGFAAATKANELGVKIAMVNFGLPLGGTCANVGCVPTKYLLNLVKTIYERGAKVTDLSAIIDDMNYLIERYRVKKYDEVLRSFENVTLCEGKGRFLSGERVDVNGQIISGEKFLIATGSSTRIIPFEEIEETDYLTNREALKLRRLPESMAIVGGGPLGLEFAQIFGRFGTKVSIIEVEERILPSQEPEISLGLTRALESEGIEVLTGTKIRKLGRNKTGQTLTLSVRDETRQLEVEKVLMATGLKGNVGDMGLDRAGVEVERDFVKVDQELRTSAPRIWAAGDVAGPPFLETVAAKEGNVAARNALEGAGIKMDYRAVPHAVFTDPEVAGVGMTEEEYMKEHGTCSCRAIGLDMVPKAELLRERRGIIKLVAGHEDERIVGVHILAPQAADLIHEAALAVRFGLTLEDIIGTLHVFPTLSEGIKLAAQSFKRDIGKMSCCVE